MRSWLRLLAAAVLMLCAEIAEAQTRYIDGVFVQSPSGPIELLAYAEMAGTGRLRLTNGAMDDVPDWGTGCRILISLPAWRAAGAIVSSEAIFEDGLAERRNLRWFARSLNIYAAEIELKELAKADYIARMLRGVKASETTPGLIFVIVTDQVSRPSSGGLRRYYPIRLDTNATTKACKP